MKISKPLFALVLALMSLNAFAWPGMDLPPLHVEGRNLQDPCGNNVILHGVAMTPSPWFNGGALGIWRWNNYDVEGCLEYNKAVMNKLTDTSDGWHLNYVRLHIDPYWTNDPGDPIPENDISRFNYDRLVQYTDEVIIPLIEHARQRGMYVILRPPGVCPEQIAVNDYYHNYLKTIWRFLSQHPGLRNTDHVMFELANEPVRILGTDGTWGSTGQTHFDALKIFFQELVDIIRSNGANNICWIPGTGWQSHYAGYANNPVTGNNIGYAVHIYPGYWGGVRNYQAFQSAWDQNVKPVADFAPIAITETDWAPEGYDTFGTATTGTAGGDGFGANLNHITYNSGNVSWNVLCPENLIHQGDPNGGIAYDGNWQACAAPVKHWFSEFANSNLPSSDCNNSSSGCSGSTSLPNGTYYITAKHSGKVLDVYNFSEEDGANIVQWDLGGDENQQWIVEQENGYYTIKSVLSDKCLDVSDWSTDDGANIQQWACNGQEVQQFCLQDMGDGYYTLTNRNSGKCIDVENASTENGANVQQWTCFNNECQQFSFTPVSNNSGSTNLTEGIYTLINRNSGQALDCFNLGSENGTNVVQWPSTGQTNQQWNITQASEGYYRISPVHAPDQALDITDASSEDGANVQLWQYWGNDCQQWRFIDSGEGYYQIEARHSGKLLEIAGASGSNGANAQQWPANGHHCQQWSLEQVLKNASAKNNMDEEKDLLEFTIFPNPSNGRLFINVPSTFEKEKINIAIYDLSGKVVFAKTFETQKQISLHLKIEEGLYFMKIYTEKQELVRKIKISN